MGFLENLRKAKEAEETRLKEARERREREEKRVRDAEAAIREELKRRRLQADAWLKKTSFPEFLKELGRFVGGPPSIEPLSNVEEGFLYRPSSWNWKSIISEDSVAIKFSWVHKELGLYDYYERAFVVEVKYSGEISIHGGFFGSSNLTPGEWEGNKSIQEKAIEKAYKHPRAVRYHYEPPLPEGRRP